MHLPTSPQLRLLAHRAALTAAAALALIAWTGCGELPDGDDSSDSDAPREGYPEGPFGTTEGSTLQNLSFVQPDGADFNLQSVHAEGTNKVMLVSTSAGWCTACIEEQPALEALYQKYKDQGLVVMVTVFEDASFAPATAQLAADWKEQYNLSFIVVADPPFVFQDYYDSSLTPMNMLVDLRDMSILKVTTGWDESLVESIIQARL